MLLLVVWTAVAVVVLVVLGSLLYALLGAVQRLRREVEAVQRDLRPVLEQAQAGLARTSAVAERHADAH